MQDKLLGKPAVQNVVRIVSTDSVGLVLPAHQALAVDRRLPAQHLRELLI